MHGLHVIKFHDKHRSVSSEETEQNSESVSKCFSLKDVSQKPKIHVDSENKKPQNPSVHKSLSRIFLQPIYDASKNKISWHRWGHKRKLSSRTLCLAKKGNEKDKKSNHKLKLNFCLNKYLSPCESVGDNIRILFKSQNWKRKPRRTLLQSKDIKKYANYYNSKSSNDLCGRNRTKNTFCCNLHIPKATIHRKSTHLQEEISPCRHKHCRHFYSEHAIPWNTDAKNNTNKCHHHAHTLAGTYNVLDFPTAVKTVITKDPPAPCGTRATDTTSCINDSKCCGDTAASPKPCSFNQSRLHSRSLIRCPKNKKFISSSKHPAWPIFITKTIKFTLFGLAVVIWLPCILIISVLWLISYPTRPREIMRAVRDVESCKTKLCNKDDQDFWYSIYNFIANAVKKLLRVYEALFSLIKKKNDKRNCTRFFASRQNVNREYPNRKKKYQLFFDNNRGWVMKPIQLRQYTCPKKNAHGLKFSLIKYENEGSNAGYLKNIIKHNTKERELECKDLQQETNKTGESVETIKKDKSINTSRDIPNEYKSQANNRTCRRDARVPDDSRFQKSHKFVKFDDRLPLHYRGDLCTEAVTENICIPFHADNRLIKRSSEHYNLSENFEPLTRTCYCTLNKSMKRPRKYPISRSFYDRYHSNIKSASRTNTKTKSRKNVCTKPKVQRVNKFVKFCQKYRQRTALVIKAADSSVWNCDKCEDTFVQTLRKRPWDWVHRRWPTFYPYFLIFCKFYENVAYAMLYLCTACVWCPVFCWCYLCCNLFCRCVL